ncbi:MAG: cell wall hydrolase, partial [Methylococcales bacterium]
MKNRSSLPLFSNLFIALALEIGLAGDSNTRPDEAYWIGAEETSIPGDADWSLSADRFGSGARGAMQGFRIREDLDCLALNIYFEARSESTLGRRAVGHVVMNRVNHRDFPHSICEVV